MGRGKKKKKMRKKTRRKKKKRKRDCAGAPTISSHPTTPPADSASPSPARAHVDAGY